MGYQLYQRNYVNRSQDLGDAPVSYKEAIHYFPEKGPYFGNLRGDNDVYIRDTANFFATADEVFGQPDEDAFPELARARIDSTSYFFPDLQIGKTAYNLKVVVKGAKYGDPIRGWIDFDGDGSFDEYEKASTYFRGNETEVLSWPNTIRVNTQLTFLRLRTCSKQFEKDIENPYGPVETGEVEDHAIRILNPVLDNEAEKAKVDFSPFKGIATLTEIRTIVSRLKADSHDIKITFDRKIPDIAGINNKHDVNIVGLRLGHSENNTMTKTTPMHVGIKVGSSVYNFSFQLLDVDAGDRIKILGFDKGNLQPFELSNISEYFFYQFCSKTNEVYGEGFADAGGDVKIPQSIDMGVNVRFTKPIDSVALIYSDDAPNTSGTFTIANINFRKLNLPQTEITDFNYALSSTKELYLNWQTNYPQNVKSYAIQRSFDGFTFETVANIANPSTREKDVRIIENTLPLSVQNCFYRIKTIEKDNFTSLTNVYLVKRQKEQKELGFKTQKNEFNSSIEFELLDDMTAGFQIDIYDYNGKRIRQESFPPLKFGQKFDIKNLDSLTAGVYYFELKAGNKFFIREGFKR